MSYYDNQAWQAPTRQQSWEQPPPPSRSGRTYEKYLLVKLSRSDEDIRNELCHTA